MQKTVSKLLHCFTGPEQVVGLTDRSFYFSSKDMKETILKYSSGFFPSSKVYKQRKLFVCLPLGVLSGKIGLKISMLDTNAV